jgi:hypothetical protein
MARSRNIKPGFFANEYLAELSPHARLLFIGLWTLADREGRLEWRPKKIKAALFPYEDVDICALMDELEACPDRVLFRYQPNNDKAPCEHDTSTGQVPCEYPTTYVQITNWHRHQNPHIKEGNSKIPAPGPYMEPAPDEHHASTIQEPDEHATSPSDSGFLIPDSLNLIPDSSRARARETPPSPDFNYPAGWEPTEETRDSVDDLLHQIEGVLGVWPFTSKQIGNGEADVIREELAAILRLLTVEEVAEIVRREMEAKVKETKGADRPVNLKFYMRAIKDAFYARDRQLEDEERRRDEERKRKRRDPADEPISIGKMLEKELSPEERAAKFREIKERIAKAGRV